MACWRNSCASRSVSARSRPASLADRPSKSICDRSMSGSGLVPSAAARMTYSSAPTERSSSASTASVTTEVRLGRPCDLRDALGEHPDRCDVALLRSSLGVGQEGLEELPHLACLLLEVGACALVDE